jgi:hypothetical protein
MYLVALVYIYIYVWQTKHIAGLREISSCFENLRQNFDQRELAAKAEFEAEVTKCTTREENTLRDVMKRADELEGINTDMNNMLSKDKVTFLQVYRLQYKHQVNLVW